MALTDIAEATEDTTSEEIAAYAARVIQEVAAERQGESDEVTNEHAENNSGNDTANDDGEETGNVEANDWLTDDVKAEAAAYGIEESDLAGFASREELNRALRLFDKKALDAGRKAAESETAQGRDEKGKFVKREEPKTEPTKEATPKEGRYQVSLSPEIYDEEIIGEFSRMRDHYESRLEVLESHFSEMREQSEHQKFDALVDSLGHADLFGKTGQLSDEDFQRRDKLFTELKYYISGRERYGVPTKLDEKTISAVADMVFSKELKKKELKQATRKISKQADGRLGGSPTKPKPPSDNPADHYDRLYKEMSGS